MAGRALFKLVGFIGLAGQEKTDAQLKEIDKSAKAVGRQFGRVARKAERLGTTMTKLVTLPIAGATAAMWKMGEAASDLAEVQSKTGEMFGESAEQIDKWSDTAAQAFGQSKTAAMDAASTFAVFGNSAGLAGDELVGFSTQFTELASDLASFNNTTPEEAITAIGAAFRGESEPMRRYGVLLDDASLRQQAFQMGIIDTIKNALTPQQKVLAASQLILKQTAKAQGDFARTSDGLANSQRILKAQIEDVSAELGQAVLPLMQQVVGFLSDKFVPGVKALFEWFDKLSPGMKRSVVQLAALAAAIGPVILLTGKLVLWGKALIPLYALLIKGQLGLNAAMTANPVGTVITLLGLLVAAGILVVNNWEVIKETMVNTWDAIVHATMQGVSFVKTAVFGYVKIYLKAI